MNTAIVLGSFLALHPVGADPPCSTAPPSTAVDAKILATDSGELEQDNRLRVRWVSITYELSTGHEAEVYLAVDALGRGEMHLFVEGEVIVYTDYNHDERGGTTTWAAERVDLPDEALVELVVPASVGELVIATLGSGPQETKCSDFGKKVVKVAGYLWVGLTAAASAPCCAAGISCPACLGASAVAGLYGYEVAQGYCD